MLPYYKLSNGPHSLLAFHGIGQSHSNFLPLAQAVEGQYALYAFDLYFHGAHPAEIEEGELTIDYWKELIDRFLQENAIDRFSVVGFSIGGMFALATAYAWSERIDALLLIAPEGVTPNPWFRLATSSVLGRALFRFFIHHVWLLHRIGLLFSMIGLVDRSALRFGERMLSTPEQQNRVSRSWLSFRKLQINSSQLAKKLNYHSVRVRLYLGHFDRIIKPASLSPLTKNLHSYELSVFKTGHHRLLEKVVEVI